MTATLPRVARAVAASPHVDSVVAGLASLLAAVEFWNVPGRSEATPVRVVSVGMGILIGLPLAWRRTAPRASFTAVMVATIGGFAAATITFGPLPNDGQGPVTPFLVLLLSVFSLGAYGRAGAALTGAVVAAAGFAAKASYGVINRTGLDLGFWVALGIFWAVGRLFRERLLRVAELQDTAVRLQQHREALAVAAVAEERSRIARELHDVVAHGVSLIVVQAAAAHHTIDPADTEMASALNSIETAGRQALVELRRMLGILRRDDEQALAPMPGLSQVEALADELRQAGLPVELRTEGEPLELPPGTDLAAYRIVQEALTNALKHAGPAHALVVVRYKAHELELEVLDDGRSQGASGDGTGHGLLGMRERVSLYGGSLHAGPIDNGGFAVRARLPLQTIST